MKNQYLKFWEAFASSPRLRIIRILLKGEICVRDFKKLLEWPQSTTSRHLLYLQKNGIVHSRKDGLWKYYFLRSAQTPLLKLLLKAAESGLRGIEPFEGDQEKLKVLKTHLKKIPRKKYSKHPKIYRP